MHNWPFGTDGTGKCIDASQESVPASQEGRKLIGYTQSLGEPCGMVSYCQSGLQCTTGLGNNMLEATGKCIALESPARAKRKLTGLRGGKAASVAARKLSTQNRIGGKYDLATSCAGGMHCSGLTWGFGVGRCVCPSIGTLVQNSNECR